MNNFALFFLFLFYNQINAQGLYLIDKSYNSFGYLDGNNQWISSQGGWNRYDGKETFHYLPDDSISGLKGEWIQSTLFPDKDKKLWTSTYEYICSFDYITDKFTCFHPVFDRDTIKLGIKIITWNAKDNSLLLKAGNNLYSYSIETGYLSPLIKSQTTNGQSFTIVKGDNKVKLYVSPWSSQLEIWISSSKNWKKKVIDFSDCPGIRDLIVYNVTIHNENKWLCTNLGLLELDEDNPCESTLHKFKNKAFISSYSIYFEDHLLVTTDEYGLLVFNFESESFTQQFSTNDQSIPLFSNRPVEIFDSGENIILSHRTKGVQYINKAILRSELLYNSIYKSIVPKKISAHDSIVVITNRIGNINIFKNQKLYDGLQINFDGILTDLIVDKNYVYFSDEYTIWKYDIAEKNLHTLFSDRTIKVNRISTFENKLFVTANNKSYILENQKLIAHPRVNENSEIINHKKFRSDLEVTARNNQVDLHEGYIHTLEIGSYIYSIFYDDIDNRLLIGSGKGLVLIDLNSLDITVKSIENGRVGKILEVSPKCFILNSSKGLFYLDSNESIKRINYGEEVLDFAISKDYLFYIEEDGLRTIPLVDITNKKDILIYVKSASHEEGKSPSSYSYSYDENPLSLKILSDDLESNEHGYFTYQIKSIHVAPVKLNFGNDINLPGLVEGNYTLDIQGYSCDLTKSNLLTINVNISGPFWRQWWFYIVSLFAVFFIAFFYFRSKNRRIQKNYRTQKNISDLERSALQAQMNPHFIFNCLNSIQGFIMDNDKEQAMEYLGGFAKLIRANLNASTSAKISLTEEHIILKNYLKLERLRLSDSFEYDIELPQDKSADDIMIPPMLIQPFVENAVIHGMRNGIKDGWIRISFNIEGSILNVKVIDNGDSSLSSVHIPEHKSVGVDITRKRLNYINRSNQNIKSLNIDHTALGTIVNLSILLE